MFKKKIRACSQLNENDLSFWSFSTINPHLVFEKQLINERPKWIESWQYVVCILERRFVYVYAVVEHVPQTSSVHIFRRLWTKQRSKRLNHSLDYPITISSNSPTSLICLIFGLTYSLEKIHFGGNITGHNRLLFSPTRCLETFSLTRRGWARTEINSWVYLSVIKAFHSPHSQQNLVKGKGQYLKFLSNFKVCSTLNISEKKNKA